MLQPLRITWYLLRIPRLLATLLLAPVATSILIVILQLFISAIFLQARHTQSTDAMLEKMEKSSKEKRAPSWYRTILIGEELRSDTVKVCLWQKDPVSGKLTPPTPDCELQRFDIVVTPAVANEFGPGFYEHLFAGLFRAVHICNGCATDIIIWRNNTEIQTLFRSLLGFSLFQEVNFSEGFKQNYQQALRARQEVSKRIGEPYFDLIGFREPTRLSSINAKVIVILNIGFVIITALWLALKAHRRVLDYLSHSGVLLPMVAATGTSTFYGAVWLLTLIRVAAFSVAAVVLGIFVFVDVITDPLAFPFYGRPLALISWIVSIIASLSLAALIASIAELKQHHDVVNIHYKLIPLIACVVGGLGWTATFLIEHPLLQPIRAFIGLIPVVGTAPILLAPVFEPFWYVLALNTLGTLALLFFVARYNSRWFAAHLDDI